MSVRFADVAVGTALPTQTFPIERADPGPLRRRVR